MWFDRKTVPSKTKNANICSQFRHARQKPKLKSIYKEKNIKSKKLCHLHFNTDKPLGCDWVSLTNGSIRVLGNVISYNDLIANQFNFLNIIPTAKDLLSIWKEQNLTQLLWEFRFSNPQLLYVTTTNTVPKTITDQLQVTEKDFIWRGKNLKSKTPTW